MKQRSHAVWLVVGCSVCLTAIGWAAHPMNLGSHVNSNNLAGADASSGPVFSADGRLVLFMSRANNLVTNDDHRAVLDLFARDLETGQTELISVDRSGQGGGNGDTAAAAISANGRYVVFASAADNLVLNDTNSGTDIFLRDLTSQLTRLVSVDFAGTNNALRPVTTRNVPLCANPLISADGRKVVFESTATNLVAGYTNTTTSVFVRDLPSQTTGVVSSNLAGMVPNPESELEAITPDGRFVLFTARSVSPNVEPFRKGEAFVRDLQEGRTHWVSSNAPGFFTALFPIEFFYVNMLNTSPVIAADGRYVAFKTQAYGCAVFDTAWVFHHDLQTASTLLVASNAICDGPLQISADGRFVAYGTAGTDLATKVFVWDHQDQSNRLVSVSRDGPTPGNGPSRLLLMTPAGGMILFSSAATDLVTNSVNGLSQLYLRDLGAGTTRLVSANRQRQGTAEDLLFSPTTMSPNGRQVAFESRAADWGAEDWNKTTDVYLWNADAENASLLSQRHPDRPDRTGAAHTGLSPGPGSINANGRYVAIRGFDNLFDSTDTNKWEDSFVRDLQTGQILHVHPDQAGQVATNAATLQPTISADGRYVTSLFYQDWQFIWLAPLGALWRWDRQGGALELVDPNPRSSSYPYLLPAVSLNWDGNQIAFVAASNGYNQVFVRDMLTQSNRLISTQPSGQPGTSHSQNPVFSPDDRWVAFESQAALLPGTEPGIIDIYAGELLSGRLVLVSQLATPNHAEGAVWSADSRKLAYERPIELWLPAIALHDLYAQTDRWVCTNCFSPSLSGEGRHTVYMQNRDVPGLRCDVVLHDLATGQVRHLATNIVAARVRSGDACGLRISHDARFVVFANPTDDPAHDDHNGTWDIFVHDRLNDNTLLISRNYSGSASANGASTHPVLAADGKTVVFQSFAEDLVEGDYNNRRDVFLLRLGGDDSDGDGLEDDWEMAYFGSLEREGSGDYDLDGHSDAQEFQAGTNPANDTSILRVLAVSLAGSDQTTLLWSAVPGRTYRLQFKTNPEDPTWTDLPGDVTTKATYGTKVDPSAGLARKRFYRVTIVL